MWNSVENAFARSASFREEGDDEEALKWAALERLPTYGRVRRGIFRDIVGDPKEIDVSELQVQEQKLVVERLVSVVDDDTERFFDRMRRRFDAESPLSPMPVIVILSLHRIRPDKYTLEVSVFIFNQLYLYSLAAI